MRTFLKWLEHVADDPSAADTVATMIAQAGAVGVSVECMRKVVRLSPETLDEVLKGLLASKQVVLLKVNGARVYRTA
jgi:predicted transcriptional regulator